MSPRQISAYLFLRNERQKRELAQQLSIITMGSRGDPDKIKQQLDKWSDN